MRQAEGALRLFSSPRRRSSSRGGGDSTSSPRSNHGKSQGWQSQFRQCFPRPFSKQRNTDYHCVNDWFVGVQHLDNSCVSSTASSDGLLCFFSLCKSTELPQCTHVSSSTRALTAFVPSCPGGYGGTNNSSWIIICRNLSKDVSIQFFALPLIFAT